MSVESSAVFGEASETADAALEIPRLDKIPNPLAPISPTFSPEIEEFDSESFNTYSKFTKTIFPKFDLATLEEAQPVVDHLISKLENPKISTTYVELMVHAFLLACSYKQTELISNPSLTRLSYLHHILYLCSEAVHNCSKLQVDLFEHCNMMIADTEDLYYSNFCEIVEHKFWGKTKSVNDLINTMLKKQFEQLRLLNEYTFKHLTILSMRKSIDSAPTQTGSELLKWAHANNIPYE